MSEKTMNEVLATRAIAAVRRVVPELSDEATRPVIVAVMQSAELFRSLAEERHMPFDVAGMRYLLRTLEALDTPNVRRSIAVGDAIFNAMQGD